MDTHKVEEASRSASSAMHEVQNLNRMARLSTLMKFILRNAGEGIDRGEVVARFYGLERRYRGYYTDPCMRGSRRTDYERRYRPAQAALTRSLASLEGRGLVELVRHGEYVKEVKLTQDGKKLLAEMDLHGAATACSM